MRIGRPNRIVARLQIRQEASRLVSITHFRGVSMKAILCSQYCGPDDLVLADVPDPVAEAGQAVIAIKSAALNFFDLLMIQGKYQIKPPFPFSPAAEVAGVIESVGAGVTDLKVGDRVVASCGHNGAREKIALPASTSSKFPTIWISIEPPASSSSTAPHCMRWKNAPASSPARPWRCLARP